MSGFYIYRNGQYLGWADHPAYSDATTNPSTTYCYRVSAYDDAYNQSAQSVEVCATTLADTTPPSAPADLKALAVSGTTVQLSWTAATDNGRVNGYNIYRDGTIIMSTAQTSLSDGALTPSNRYCYTVTAVDEIGNESVQSMQICVKMDNWHTELLTQTLASTEYRDTSIAVDSHYSVHIHYSYDENFDTAVLMHNYYMTNAGGSWISIVVDSPSCVNADIAVDSSDFAHLSYLGFPGVTYATYTSGVWTKEVLDGEGECDASLVIDASSNVHMIYYADATQPVSAKELRYATNASGAWKISVVDTFADYGCYVGDGKSLALFVDAKGFAHIAYLGEYPQYGLKYATNQTGSWNTSMIASGNDKSPSISVDAGETVHVVYSGDLGLTHASNAGGLWAMDVIDSGTWPRFPSFAMDSAGNKFIIYLAGNYFYGNGELRYTTDMYGGWSTSVVDNDVCATNIAIALDSQSKAHISYFGNQNCSLKYATNK